MTIEPAVLSTDEQTETRSVSISLDRHLDMSSLDVKSRYAER